MRSPEHLTVALIDAGLDREQAMDYTITLMRTEGAYENLVQEIADLTDEIEKRTRLRAALVTVRDRMAMTDSTGQHTPPEIQHVEK